MPFDPRADIATLGAGRRARAPGTFDLLEDAWHAAKGPRALPLRSDIDPVSFGDLLPRVMILERVAPGIARIRVAGQGIAALTGMDPRGIPVSALFDAGSRAGIGAQVEATFAGPSIVEAPIRSRRRLMRGAAQGRLMMLPLADGFGQVTRALCALEFEGRGAAAPMILDEAGTFRCDVIAVERVMLTRTGRSDDRRPAGRDGAEDEARGAERQGVRPKLRLVVSNV